MWGRTGLVSQPLHAHLSVTLPSDSSLPRNACHKVLRLSFLLHVSIAAAGPETHLTELLSVTWKCGAGWATVYLRATQMVLYIIIQELLQTIGFRACLCPG